MTLVDFHTHVMPPWVMQDRASLARTDACFEMLYADPKARLTTADDLINSMDETGIAMSVALNIGWSTHEMCMRTNDYLLESASRWPGRIVPFCMLHLMSPDLALHELERCAAGGARGVGELRPDVQSYSLTDASLWKPLVDVLNRHEMILLTHVSEPVGHQYPGKGTITPEQPYAFAKEFPEATLVCAHWGGGLPFYALMPEVGKTLANVYFDTAATHYLYEREVFDTVARLVGADHILFGSDYPLIPQKRALDIAREAIALPDNLRAVLGDNAIRVLATQGDTTP